MTLTKQKPNKKSTKRFHYNQKEIVIQDNIRRGDSLMRNQLSRHVTDTIRLWPVNLVGLCLARLPFYWNGWSVTESKIDANFNDRTVFYNGVRVKHLNN